MGKKYNDGQGYARVREGYRELRYDHPRLQRCHYVDTAALKGRPHKWHFEHRLVVAEREKRALAPWERVTHKDGNRLNNDPSNLEIMNVADLEVACAFLMKEAYDHRLMIRRLQAEVAELKGRPTRPIQAALGQILPAKGILR